MSYRQINLTEREQIKALKKAGKSYREIGKILGRSHTSVMREWKRHSNLSAYQPAMAQAEANYYKKKQRRQAALKNNQIWLYVCLQLLEGWSPEEISGRIKRDIGERIHHSTIYEFIYRQKKEKGSPYYRYLKRKHPKQKKQEKGARKRGKISDRVSIEERPKKIEKRRKLGHWESDNMQGRKTDQTVLSVTVERMSRYVRIEKLVDKKANTKSNSIIRQLKSYPKRARRSITLDNGFENRKHAMVKQALQTQPYFCNPYSSWEKGSVENIIGRIRYFIPKGKGRKKGRSLDSISKEEIKEIETKMNNTPRKCLNYLTPKEVFDQLLLNL
jgi:IS30 family transposase